MGIRVIGAGGTVAFIGLGVLMIGAYYGDLASQWAGGVVSLVGLLTGLIGASKR